MDLGVLSGAVVKKIAGSILGLWTFIVPVWVRSVFSGFLPNCEPNWEVEYPILCLCVSMNGCLSLLLVSSCDEPVI